MNDDRLYVNGIDGASGGYLTEPATPQELAEAALGDAVPPEQIELLKKRWARASLPPLAPGEGLDQKALDQVGWGVIFPIAADPDARQRQEAIKEALSPLLEHRRARAGGYYREYVDANAPGPDDSALNFLARNGAGPGPADPETVPYYLLIVGDPEAVPFGFQYQLDVQYAVGRLHFDTVEEYARYARGVVAAETVPRAPRRRVAFFGARNPDDPATEQSADLLIGPLAAKLAVDFKDDGWSMPTFVGDGQATKTRLGDLVGGDETPDLLFTASHGMAFPLGDARQIPHQGAILCQDWPGPKRWGRRPIPSEHYFSADDIPDSAGVGGLITFHFACYGAGTPRLDDYPHPKLKARPTIAPRAFLSRLSQRLLGHPGGGALAVVGHVERAWPCSFVWKQAGKQVEVFRSALKRLLRDHPVGSALDYFNVRYAELSSHLSYVLGEARFGMQPDPDELAGLWTANCDARGYIVLGDPAVRLPHAASDSEH